MKNFLVDLKNRSYQISIEPGIVHDLAHLLQKYNTGQKWVIISQQSIMDIIGYGIEDKLKKANFDCVIITLPDGEIAKTVKSMNCFNLKPASIISRLKLKKYQEN